MVQVSILNYVILKNQKNELITRQELKLKNRLSASSRSEKDAEATRKGTGRSLGAMVSALLIALDRETTRGEAG